MSAACPCLHVTACACMLAAPGARPPGAGLLPNILFIKTVPWKGTGAACVMSPDVGTRRLCIAAASNVFL